MLWALNVVLLLLLLGTALAVVFTRDLLAAAVILSGNGLLMAVLWTRLAAPDLALIFAAIGVCITTVMMVLAVNRTERRER